MIILAELSGTGPAGWLWVDTAAPHRRGILPPALAPAGAAPGDRAALDVEWRRADWRVRRVVGREPTGRGEPTQGAKPTARAEATLRVGDLVVADIRFTHRPGARDQGRQRKSRPCVVVGIDRDDVVVRPVFGSNSAVRREGLGRRIRDWRAAGLFKPSVVSACNHYLPLGRTGRRVGRLSEHDRARLFGH